ncbi:MAG: hypothetical protein Q7U60_06800, partial [Candidatus Methanoperedens sp.]|nr:hypothetical protein [Candidatus Methanoperedens sp.]
MVRQINQNQIWKKKFRFNNSAAVISLIIILFLIISMSGCLEKLNPVSSANNADLNKNITIKKEQPKEILLKSYDDIYVELNNFKKFSETDCINKLTQLQCDNKIEEYVTYIKNNINGHYVE